MRVASHSRTSGWSSTRKTLALSIMGFPRKAAFKPLATDACPVRGQALNVEFCSDDTGTVGHNSQAHAFAPRRLIRQANTVIADCQYHALRGGFEAHDDLFGVAVFDGVGDRFLRDTIQMSGHSRFSNLHGLVALEIARCLESFGDGRSQSSKRVREALPFQFKGMKAVRQRAGQFNSSLNQFHDVVHRFRFGKRFGCQLLAQNLARPSHTRHVWAQTVVQIVTDALLFALADTQNLLLQPHALLHFVVERSRSLAHAFLKLVVQGAQLAEYPNDDQVKRERNRRVPDRHKRTGIAGACNQIARDRNRDAQRGNEDAKSAAHKPYRKNDRDQVEREKIKLKPSAEIEKAN